MYTVKLVAAVVTFLVVYIAGAEKSPINTVLSENTSSTGNPEISFTENNDPDKLSVIENNSPCDPCTVNTGLVDPEPYTVNVDPDIVPIDPDKYAREPDNV